jgi:hypothetical protein
MPRAPQGKQKAANLEGMARLVRLVLSGCQTHSLFFAGMNE